MEIVAKHHVNCENIKYQGIQRYQFFNINHPPEILLSLLLTKEREDGNENCQPRKATRDQKNSNFKEGHPFTRQLATMINIEKKRKKNKND